MPTRTKPSTSQNRKPVAEPALLNSPVRNSGARKNRPMAKAKAMTSVMPISFLPSSLLLLAERLVGRDGEGADADDQRLDERDDAAQDRQS